MTNSEVIKRLNRLLTDNIVVGTERIAVEVAIVAVAKREPMEPLHIVESRIDLDENNSPTSYYGDCPACGNHMDSLWTDKYFCSKCGQAMMWPYTNSIDS